jgi:hypothetical protein
MVTLIISPPRPPVVYLPKPSAVGKAIDCDFPIIDEKLNVNTKRRKRKFINTTI